MKKVKGSSIKLKSDVNISADRVLLKGKKTKTYDAFSEDEIPEYYCNIHNSNPEKYPISPEETLVEQKKDSSASTPSSPTTPSSP